MGTRNGGAVVSAWASIMALGEEGFMALMEETMKTAAFFKEEINKLEDLEVIAKPHGTVFAF